jgi:hypothetical protein
MSDNGSTSHRNFPAKSDVKVLTCVGLPKLSCPFCGAANTAVLAGKIAFEAKLGGDDFWEGLMVGFVCPQSHLFFLRNEDVALPSMIS